MMRSMNVILEEISFELPHIKLAALTNNNTQAPLILCLHGWLDNAASFTKLIPYLNDYYVVVIEWPGHGHSAHRGSDAYYHFSDYLSDLYVLIEQQKWLPVDIVAHSMGAMIATVFAAAFPEKINTLTLIDSIGLMVESADDTAKNLRKALSNRHKAKRKEKTIHPSIDSAVKARMSVSDLTYEDANILVTRALTKHENGYVWRSDRRLRLLSPYRYTSAQAQNLIKNITSPVQLISGTRGIDFMNGAKHQFMECYPKIETHEIDAGHHVHMEKPKETANHIITFLKNVDISL